MTKEINPAAQNITVGQAFVDKVSASFALKLEKLRLQQK